MAEKKTATIQYPTQRPTEFGWISRNLKYGLVYEGKLTSIDQTFDSHQSVTRRDQVNQLIKEIKHNNIQVMPVTIEVYGKKIKHDLPVRTPTEDQPAPPEDDNITSTLYDYIVQRAKWKMLSDNVL